MEGVGEDADGDVAGSADELAPAGEFVVAVVAAGAAGEELPGKVQAAAKLNDQRIIETNITVNILVVFDILIPPLNIPERKRKKVS